MARNELLYTKLIRTKLRCDIKYKKKQDKAINQVFEVLEPSNIFENTLKGPKTLTKQFLPSLIPHLLFYNQATL